MGTGRLMTRSAALLLLLFLTGCAEIEVENHSERAARILVVLPGEKHESRTLVPGETAGFPSDSGGTYHVYVINQEEYASDLQRRRMFLERQMRENWSTLSLAQRQEFREEIQALGRTFERLQREGTSCIGQLPEDELVTVVVNSFNRQWELTCP